MPWFTNFETMRARKLLKSEPELCDMCCVNAWITGADFAGLADEATIPIDLPTDKSMVAGKLGFAMVLELGLPFMA
jgi:hypothetical protein